MFRGVLVVVACILSAGVANAGVVYDERSSGDLPQGWGIVLNLTLGENTVLGSSYFTATGLDSDRFAVVVPEGVWLSGIQFSFDTSLLSGTGILETTYVLGDPQQNYGEVTEVDLIRDSSPVSFFGPRLPLGPGTWYLSHSTFGRAGPGGAWDYQFDFHVIGDEVPEPSVLVVLCFGLIGASILRRRRMSFYMPYKA